MAPADAEQQQSRTGKSESPSSTVYPYEALGTGNVGGWSCKHLFLIPIWMYCLFSWVVGLCTVSVNIVVFPGTSFAYKETKSLLQTISYLWHNRLYFSMALIFIFSLMVPVTKIIGSAMLLHVMRRRSGQEVRRDYKHLIDFLHYTASYQLLDIFVGVLFVSFFTSDSAEAQFGPGFYWFFSYCVVSCGFAQVMEEDLSRGAVTVNAKVEAAQLSREDITSGAAAGSTLSLFGYAERRSDLRSVLFFSLCYVVLLVAGIVQPLLEVSTMFSGISLDKRTLTVTSMLLEETPSFTHPLVSCLLILFVLVLPLIYVVVVVMSAVLADTSTTGVRTSRQRILDILVLVLRPWVMTDVLGLGSMIFLFMVQDPATLTRSPPGSWGLECFLGAGVSLFFLRWFIDGADPHTETSGTSTSSSSFCAKLTKFWICVVLWVVSCLVVIIGVPGQIPAYSFHSLEEVCQNTKPMLDAAAAGIPATYGACNARATKPPLPCIGHESLYEQDDAEKGYVRALWISGLNTLRFERCSLEKHPSLPGKDKASSIGAPEVYRLALHGMFDRISMYLDLNQCGSLGCTRINSADSCCGDDIRFRIEFQMQCSPDRPGELEGIRVTNCSTGPMYVHQDKFGGMLQVDAYDVGPEVAKVVQQRIAEILDDTKITWGGHSLTLPQFLSRLVAYNAPRNQFIC